MQARSRRSGRISFVLLAAIVAAFFVALLFLFNNQSPTQASGEFLTALAQQNSKKLADVSVIHNKTPEEVKAAWDKTFEYSKHYLFVWRILSADQDEKSARVRIQVVRNALRQNSYEENYALVLTKVDGKWKVVVPEIPREMFPNLPE